MSALELDALNAAALAQRAAVLDRLVYRDGRVSNEVRALNWEAPRLPGVHVKLNETGRWFVSTDTASTSGHGVVELVACLACVSIVDAAAFVAHLPEIAL